jgi:hypothetical protein
MSTMLIVRSIRWSAWEGCEAGMEQADLSPAEGGLDVAGVVVGRKDGARFGLFYRLRLDALWHVREAHLRLTSGRVLHLESNGRGSWHENGREQPTLQGCVDIDIEATPMTNTLPIRRLAMKPGDTSEIRLCYIDVPELTTTPARQRYTALDDGSTFRFEAIESGFAADLPLDEDGIVRDYPGLFRRLD